MLSPVTTHLSPEAMQSILDGVAIGAAHRAEGYDPAVVEDDHGIEKEVHATAGWVLVEMHVTDWAKTQRGTSAECCVGLAGSLKEHWSEDTS